MREKLFSKKALYYILTAIVAIGVGLIGGIVDTIQPQGLVDTATHLRYPLYFFTLLGVFKILGAIALFLPNRFDVARNIAYLGFTFDFIFASFSHFSVGDPISKIVTPLVFLLILALSYSLKNRL